MSYDPGIHHRRSIRLRGWDYSWAGWYYVTICVQSRECLLGRTNGVEIELSKFGQIVDEIWRWLPERYAYVSLDEFQIMPNHIHGIIIIDDIRWGGSRTAPTKSLGRLIGALKTVSTKKINQLRNVPGAKFWQRNYYEHIIRNDADLRRIREYIRNNPLRWSLDKQNPGPKP